MQRMQSSLRDNNRSEEHTSELQSRQYLVCRLLLEKKKIAEQLHECVEHFCRLRVILVLVVSLPDAYFFFNDPATTEIYTLSLHAALPISSTPENDKMEYLGVSTVFGDRLRNIPIS